MCVVVVVVQSARPPPEKPKARGEGRGTRPAEAALSNGEGKKWELDGAGIPLLRSARISWPPYCTCMYRYDGRRRHEPLRKGYPQVSVDVIASLKKMQYYEIYERGRGRGRQAGGTKHTHRGGEGCASSPVSKWDRPYSERIALLVSRMVSLSVMCDRSLRLSAYAWRGGIVLVLAVVWRHRASVTGSPPATVTSQR